MLLKEERKAVIDIALKARELKLVPLTFGNFSLFDKLTEYICITPSGIDYDELRPEDIVVVDKSGIIVEGKKKPSIETPLHCAVYQRRTDIGGICHTHSTYATAWASTNKKFPVIVAELVALIGETLLTAPYRPLGTYALAEAVVDTLEEQEAVLMANHGLLTVGKDIKKALNNACIVEEAAKVAFLAHTIGDIKPLSSEECISVRDWVKEKYGQ